MTSEGMNRRVDLINFCDCLMAGGTGRSNHSEVGSSYILNDILEAKEKGKTFWWHWLYRFSSYYDKKFGEEWEAHPENPGKGIRPGPRES